MKKFIRIIIEYAVVLFAVICVINYIYVWKDSKNNKFKNIPDNIQICNLGSSHGRHGYNYEDVEGTYTCFNFALDSQTLSYDFRVFDAYKDKIEKGGIVFIDISYFAPYGILEEEAEDFMAKNRRYYEFLPHDKIKNYNIKTDLSVRFRSLSRSPVDVMRTIFYPTEMLKDNLEWWTVTAETLDVKESAKAAYRRHCVDGKVDDTGKLIYNEEEIDALNNLIDTCRQIDARPILVTGPYLSEYIEAINEGSPDFFDEFYSWLNGVIVEKDVEYYDYSKDSRFSDRYDLFNDADHLNKEGARLFTNILMDEVLNFYV